MRHLRLPLWVAGLVLILAQLALAQGVVPVALPRLQLFDANGHPLSGGKLDTFAAGTTTPLVSYTDATGTTPNTNPVIADAGGFMSVYLPAAVAYKLRVSDAQGAVLTTVDNIVLNPQVTLTGINDYSATATQGNETMDPGEPGAEILATNAAQEITQLRFRIGEMTGENWRKKYTNRTANVHSVTQADINATWVHGSATVWVFKFRVPDSWDGTSTLHMKLLRRFTTAGGQAKMFWSFSVNRDGALPATSGNGVIDFVHTDGLNHLLDLALTGTTVLPGDYVTLSITRQGDDLVNDTNLGNVIAGGYWLEYVGIGSR